MAGLGELPKRAACANETVIAGAGPGCVPARPRPRPACCSVCVCGRVGGGRGCAGRPPCCAGHPPAGAHRANQVCGRGRQPGRLLPVGARQRSPQPTHPAQPAQLLGRAL
jgi:hypothetical protein